jgi:hypothetical protein
VLQLIVALFATQLVVGLYGAGVRRPFGSLPTIPDVPMRLWRKSMLVKTADWLFVLFLLAMWTVFAIRMNFVLLTVLATIFYIFAESMSYRIRLLPSFYISVALVFCSIFLVFESEPERTVMASLF